VELTLSNGLHVFHKGSGLSGSIPSDPKTGGSMLSITGINRFYYFCGFTDMHCKHFCVLPVIRELLRREPLDGDIYIVMSKDHRIVRLFAYGHRSYSLNRCDDMSETGAGGTDKRVIPLQSDVGKIR